MSNLVPLTQNTAPVRVHSSSVLADPQQFEMNMRAAEVFAKSDLVPGHYKGKPGNVFIAINRAQRLGVDEMYFLEKTYVVSGKLGLAAELAIELANSSGRFKAPMTFHLFGEGEGRGCTAKAILAATGECVENTVTYAMAKADGWTKNSKWTSLRDQMLQYRAGAFLARLYAGGAMGGLYTREELEDIQQQPAAAPMIEHHAPMAALPTPEPELSGSMVVRVEKPAAVPLFQREKYALPVGQIDKWFGVFAKAADAAPSWQHYEKLCEDNVLMVDALQASKEHAGPFDVLNARIMDKFGGPGEEVADAEPEKSEEIPF